MGIFAKSADPFAALMEELRAAVLDGPGTVEPRLRRMVAEGRDLPSALTTLVEKISKHAYRVTDEDIAALRDLGYSDDQIFEITISAALGASLKRLDAGFRALGGGQ